MPFRAEGLDELRRRVDIAAVVGQTVALRRQGQRLVGLCPFHSEKSPSFSVSPERGLFYCFGCHAGGDAIDFVMRRDSLSFREAVEILAVEFHVELPEERGDGQEAQRQERRARLLQLMQSAQERLQANLFDPQGEAARRYLAGRGLHAEDARRFDLGYAAGGSDLCRSLGAPDDLLLEAGLAARRDGGGLYDRFRERVTFAIRDRAGRIVGFGGRALGDALPKYLNSSETPLFHKGSLLYGWPWAQRAMQEGALTLVEGYMDAIALHRHGFSATVATLGTALTEEHARQIGRAVRRVHLAFDSDRAGKLAVRRCAEPLLQQGLEVLVVTPPGGKDPDEVLAAGGKDAWQGAVAAAEGVMAWLYGEAVQQYGTKTPAAIARVTEEVFTALRAVESPLVRDEEIRRLAGRLGVREEALRAEFQRLGRTGDRTHMLQNARNSTRNTAPSAPRPDFLPLETAILKLAEQYPGEVPRIRAACRPLRDPACEAALELLSGGGDPGASDDESVRRAWAEAAISDDLPQAEIPKLLARWTEAGKRMRLNEVQRIIAQMQEVGQPIDASLIVEANELRLQIGMGQRG